MKIDFLRKISSLKKSRDFKNVSYSLLSYSITPFVIFITTPLLLKYLGPENYGIWVLINSVAAFMTFSNFGLGNALIKLGSEIISDSKDSRNEFNRLFSVTLTLTILISCLFVIVIFLFGPSILSLFIKGHTDNATLNLSYLLGFITVLKLLNNVIAASFMAKQRYDLNSKINIAVNQLSVLVYTVIAVLTGSLFWLVIALLISSLVLMLISILVAKKVVQGIRYSPSLDKKTAKKIIDYGFYSWSQSFITSIQGSADKFIIGGLLGPATMGYYTVCMTLVTKIQEIPYASGGFLLAKFSALHETNNYKKISRVYHTTLILKSIFIVCATSFVIVFAKEILAIWISESFANQHYELLRILAIGVAISAFSVFPSYCMNAMGFVKINSIISFIMSAISLGFLYFFIPEFGVYGTGYGRLAGLPVLLFLLYFVERNVLNKKSYSGKKAEAFNS
ncbi:flippase [Cohnella thermotolerans]|uniref:flippase n=1 Tax=Cohnella thermotolerans TaxID=329858 RepID=UPI00040900D7|nr:flippase [Cohnella thermotolerans]